MEVVLWISLIVSISFVIWLFYQLQDFKAKNTHFDNRISELNKENAILQTKLNDLREDNNNLSIARNFLELQANSAADEKNRLEQDLELLREELIQLQISTSVEAVKNDSVEDLETQLANLRRIIDDKVVELENLNSSAAEITELMNTKVRGLEELEAGMKALEGRICDGKKVLEGIESEIVSTNSQLTMLANLKASVLAVEEGAGSVWTFSPGDKKRLVELIHQLVDEYGSQFPILRKELLKAEWSSVWLPQVQQLCSREGLDRSGIYRLTLKSNPDCVYIGQAQSIKDRWYTHIKKMLGVEAKGTERLYEYGPDDFEWSVVEFKEGNLDSDEKYWIDYFKCREIGLNKKG